MKKLILATVIALIFTVPTFAQKGLAINELFGGRYRSDPNAVETTITGDMLNSHDITKYRSISITGKPTEASIIEKVLNSDASRALEAETSYRGGSLYYAFYCLPTSDGENRYIVYINQYPAGGDKILLVYLQGYLSSRKVREMMKK